jgi:hypothetical protein
MLKTEVQVMLNPFHTLWDAREWAVEWASGPFSLNTTWKMRYTALKSCYGGEWLLVPSWTIKVKPYGTDSIASGRLYVEISQTIFN